MGPQCDDGGFHVQGHLQDPRRPRGVFWNAWTVQREDALRHHVVRTSFHCNTLLVRQGNLNRRVSVLIALEASYGTNIVAARKLRNNQLFTDHKTLLSMAEICKKNNALIVFIDHEITACTLLDVQWGDKIILDNGGRNFYSTLSNHDSNKFVLSCMQLHVTKMSGRPTNFGL